MNNDLFKNGSGLMTRLRVLSGAHAGANLHWVHQVLKVGQSEDLDVYIGDWNAPTVELHRDADGRCEARWLPQDGSEPMLGAQRDGDWLRYPLAPWVPLRFGAVVLCIGPSDEAWPDDVDLLQRLFAPTPAPSRTVDGGEAGAARKRPAVMIIAVIAGLGLAASAAMRPADEQLPGGLLTSATQTVAASVPTLQVLKAALGPRLANGLSLTAQGAGFQVQGVVDTRADLAEVSRVLDRLPASIQVARRYTAAPDVVDMVMASVPGAALTVERTAPRRFEVSGRTADLSGTQGLIERLGSDLQTVGVELVAAVTDSSKPGTSGAGISGMLIDPQGVSFSRTRDGVKHIVVQARTSGVGSLADAQANPQAHLQGLSP